MNNTNPNVLKRLWRLIVSIGPAFFLVGYTIGTGSVVTMASAGSRYGMSMLWVLVLACVFCFALLEAYGRYSLVTGEGSLYGFKKHIRGGRCLAIIILTGLVIVEFLALAGNMGIVTDLIHEWTAMLFGGKGWNPVWVAVSISIIIYTLIMMGKYSLFEKILIIFVGCMGLSFLMTMFIVIPIPSEIAKGLLPSVPAEANSAMIIAAIVGTTFTAPTFVVRGILMKEKKWKIAQLNHAKKDAAMGAFMMFLVSMSVMSCAAGTLYLINHPVDKVVTMVALLQPLLGKLAISVFVTGIIGAALSSMIPILMLAPLLISDYTNKPVKYRGSLFRLLSGGALLFGLIVPVLKAKPVFAMLISQVFQVFVLPVVILAILYLLNRKDLMGNKKAELWLNGSLIISLLFSLGITYQGIVGLIESFNSMF
jgi:manganese transport protein